MWERHYNRHVKSVMKSGKPARAQVLAAEECEFSGMSTGDVSSGWNMQLRVTPEGVPPFDLQARMEIPISMVPLPGMDLQVIYDPAKPQSIVIDPASVPKDPKAAEIAQAIATARARGDDTTGMQEAGDAASTPMEAAAAAMAVARRNQVARWRAMSTPAAPGSADAPQAATPEQRVAIEARLAQLTQLNAAGVLPDATYEAAKQQLLDGL